LPLRMLAVHREQLSAGSKRKVCTKHPSLPAEGALPPSPLRMLLRVSLLSLLPATIIDVVTGRCRRQTVYNHIGMKDDGAQRPSDMAAMACEARLPPPSTKTGAANICFPRIP
jgi:hypothetical protein